MKQKLLDYLSTKGITYQDTGDIVSFANNNINYMCAFDQNDGNFFQFLIPDIEPSQDIDDQIKQKVDRLSKEVKVAKIFIIRDQVWISVESFVYSYENLTNLIERLLGVGAETLRRYRNS